MVFVRMAVAAAGVAAIAVSSAAPADADPVGNSCPLLLRTFCSSLPILPDLDHDVDLTTDPNGLAGNSGTSPAPSVGAGG